MWNGIKTVFRGETQNISGFVYGLLVGVAGGFFLALVFSGILWEWGVVKGAKWWEVMTAIGTIGATIGTAYGAWHAATSSNRAKRNAAWGALRKIFHEATKVEEQLLALKHVASCKTDPIKQYEKTNLALNSLERFIGITVSREEEVALLAYSPEASEALDRAVRQAIGLKGLLELTGWGMHLDGGLHKSLTEVLTDSISYRNALKIQIGVLTGCYVSLTTELGRNP